MFSFTALQVVQEYERAVIFLLFHCRLGSILFVHFSAGGAVMFSFIPLQVVQEYERAVIFRLGRLPQGGAKGPGMCRRS